jgi:hypothetical protein
VSQTAQASVLMVARTPACSNFLAGCDEREETTPGLAVGHRTHLQRHLLPHQLLTQADNNAYLVNIAEQTGYEHEPVAAASSHQ